MSLFSRFTIKKQASNPLMLPAVPTTPEPVKKQYPFFEKMDAAWREWRDKAQKQIEQAIMALKLDENATASGVDSQQQQALIDQLDDLDKQVTTLTTDVTELNRVIDGKTDQLETITYPIIDAVNSKEPIIQPGTTAQYYRGDKTWATLNTSAVAEGSNLYFTDARVAANSAVAANTAARHAAVTLASTPNGLTLSGQQLGMLQASDSQDGTLSHFDWIAFNQKQAALGFTPENSANKAQTNGYASLDSTGKVPSSQLPALTINNTFVVNSESAMTGLSTAVVGDIAVRTDVSKTFILKQTPYSTLANWQEMLVPSNAVTSVFSRTGAVVAATNDYSADQILETSGRVFVTPAQKTVLSNTSNTNTGDQTLSSLGAAAASDLTSHANLTTTAHGGIVASTDSRLTDSRNAADVYAWAKAATKPTYTHTEVGAAPSSTVSFPGFGTTAGTACEGNDPRLLGQQGVALHASSHVPGGSDALPVDSAAAVGSLRTLGTSATSACAGNDSRLSNSRVAADVYAWAKAVSKPSYTYSEVGAAPDTTVSFPGFGTTDSKACVGNDSRLSDSRTASDVYAWAKSATKPGYSVGEIAGAAALAGATFTGAVNVQNDVSIGKPGGGASDGTNLHMEGKAGTSWGYAFNNKSANYMSFVSDYSGTSGWFMDWTGNIGVQKIPDSSYAIDVLGSVKCSAYFYGDGSRLTGITPSQVGAASTTDLSNHAGLTSTAHGGIIPDAPANGMTYVRKDGDWSVFTSTGLALGGGTPAMNGVAAAGTADTAAHQDHVHPVDTSRAAASDLSSHTGSTTAAHGGIVASNDSRLTDSRNAADVYAWAKAATKPSYTYTEVGAAPSSTVSFPGFGSTGSTACVGNDSRLSDARNAADVYTWAKAETKPTYTYSEVGAAPAATVSFPGFGTSGTTACVGNDSRLSDARTPTTHTHTTLGDVTFGGSGTSLAFSGLYQTSNAYTLNNRVGNYLTLACDAAPTSPFTINYLGNFGFGTTSISEKVEVNGNVKATSFIGSGASLTGITYSQVGAAPSSTVSFPGFGTSGTTACVGNDSRLSDSRTASDVYAWAKASTKPSYSVGEISGAAALSGATFSGAVSVPSLTLSTPVWDDLQIPGLSVKLGATAPTLGNFAGTSLMQVYFFAGTATDDIVYFTIQLPHSYKEGTDIVPHVHWTPTTSTTGKQIQWNLNYSWKNVNEVFSTSTVASASGVSVPATAWTHTITELPSISGAGKTISSMLVCSLSRSGSADSYNDAAAFLQFDIHFQKDTIGSANETSK